MEISLNDSFSLMPTWQTESLTRGSEGTLSAGALGANLSDAIHIVGFIDRLDASFGPSDAASWILNENATIKNGIPAAIRVGILLKRSTDDDFKCTVNLETKANFTTRLKELFGGREIDEPILFQPKLPPTNKLKKYNIENLGSFDVTAVEDVTFTTMRNAIDGDEDYEEDIPAKSFAIQDSLMEFHNKFLDEELSTWSANDEFWNHYPHLNQSSDRDGKNILHLLIENYTKLPLNTKTKSGICKAITKIVARSIVDNCVASPSVDGLEKKPHGSKTVEPLSEAIATDCIIEGRTENSLHYVLRESFSEININILIETVFAAPEAAIVSADSDGFTPLHYAVVYKNSNEIMYRIVRTLLKKGDTDKLIMENKDILDLRTKAEKLLVYQYLMRTREQLKEKPQMLQPSGNDSSRDAY
ncbi:hypothetical protein TruAng_001936 [Truncatella angustata]|nr:hypothetical protein TruAng_001936 [Truncatella angustata]